MHHLLDTVWPHRPPGTTRNQQNILTDDYSFKVLEICRTRDSNEIEIGLMEEPYLDLSHDADDFKEYLFRLVVMTRFWKSFDTSHEKTVSYNISQENLTKIVNSQGLRKFFSQTRIDVVGLFSSSMAPHTDDDESEYFALLQDTFLGLWAMYNKKHKQWQGICFVIETSLDLTSIARELVSFVPTKEFMYLFAAKYILDFLSQRSGEIPKQIIEIEWHSGHHDSIVKPVPAGFEKLETISAIATAAANLVSYHNIVIGHLAMELLQFIQENSNQDDIQVNNVKQNITYLRQRVKFISAYLSYLERRAERQVTASCQLLTQANVSINLDVARDTKMIAIASKHDSSSMKILAVFTIIFLPGAFIATLFSMNMFNWFAADSDPVLRWEYKYYDHMLYEEA